MKHSLYSIRMRAACGGRHISGAERLAGPERLEQLAAAMVRRALEHDKGQPDDIVLTVEAVDPQTIVRRGLPDLRTVAVTSVSQGRAAALEMLIRAGVAPEAARGAMASLAGGAAPDGCSMRGAMLVDAVSGWRREMDRWRGVRVSRMDLEEKTAARLQVLLASAGLDNPHVREALVLAGKVMHAPGVVAELCWSDDPAYTAGYVAAPCFGYVRFPWLKPAGEERGGRAFFLAPEVDLEGLYDYLQRQVVLFDRIGRLLPEERWPA